MVVKKEDNSMVRTVGRRKTATARVRLSPGKGIIIINDKPFTEFFPIELWSDKVIAPLKIVSREKDFDISVKIVGGGVNSQAEAVRHGIARALIKWDETLRPILKAEGFLTRDSRGKERKKFGLHKARRAHQWRKR
jgi:small subunit ribosomal protein S9